MSSLVHSQEFESWGSSPSASARTEAISLLRSIPPERVGLNGEYDHSGLAKRVEQAFRQQFQTAELERLSITQRGRVVVLDGWVTDQALLDRLVHTALSVAGASSVESLGVAVLTTDRLDLPQSGSASLVPDSAVKAIASERPLAD